MSSGFPLSLETGLVSLFPSVRPHPWAGDPDLFQMRIACADPALQGGSSGRNGGPRTRWLAPSLCVRAQPRRGRRSSWTFTRGCVPGRPEEALLGHLPPARSWTTFVFLLNPISPEPLNNHVQPYPKHRSNLAFRPSHCRDREFCQFGVSANGMGCEPRFHPCLFNEVLLGLTRAGCGMRGVVLS